MRRWVPSARETDTDVPPCLSPRCGQLSSDQPATAATFFTSPDRQEGRQDHGTHRIVAFVSIPPAACRRARQRRTNERPPRHRPCRRGKRMKRHFISKKDRRNKKLVLVQQRYQPPPPSSMHGLRATTTPLVICWACCPVHSLSSSRTMSRCTT